MKLATFGILAVLLAAAFTMGGCALFGPSVEKAREVAEARQAEADAAVKAWETALAELEVMEARWEAFQREWAAAAEANDTNALERLKAQGALLIDEGKRLAADVKAKEDLVKTTGDVLKSAIKDFEDAESTSDYIGMVLGWGVTLLGSVFGAGGLAAGISSKRKATAEADEREKLAAAARLTAANAHTTFGADVAKWEAFLRAQEASMATVPGARAAFAAARRQ